MAHYCALLRALLQIIAYQGSIIAPCLRALLRIIAHFCGSLLRLVAIASAAPLLHHIALCRRAAAMPYCSLIRLVPPYFSCSSLRLARFIAPCASYCALMRALMPYHVPLIAPSCAYHVRLLRLIAPNFA